MTKSHESKSVVVKMRVITRKRQDHQLEVEGNGAPTDIEDLIEELVTWRGIVSASDLCLPGNARSYEESSIVARHSIDMLVEKDGSKGSWPDHVHIAPNDIDELG